MEQKILIAGSGGQGVMKIGFLLANCAMQEGAYTSCMPSYGPEMRGGTANCAVVISDKQITSPITDQYTGMILMNGPSFVKFSHLIEDNGDIILNTSSTSDEIAFEKNQNVIGVACNEIANDLGDVRAANMVALGAYVGRSGCLSLEAILKEVENTFAGKTKVIQLNQKAVELGYQCAKK
ncbi:2-oxoacid:acceptor oxidoreductase family protein [Anaerotignum sp.]|uniref:2-oxoacid:acceptor oxidoreductase family protein n=1 Tax=Anaerotignum sp. TaxID=2039241 RepID=UPI00373532D4